MKINLAIFALGAQNKRKLGKPQYLTMCTATSERKQ
jgi:hypothetical protein